MTDGAILGIDTSTLWLNLALLDRDGRPLGEVHEQVRTHATGLVAGLEALMDRAGLAREGLEAVGVVVGPGSFTGLRVGLAAAEGLGEALSIPAFGLDSLSALARSSPGEGDGFALLDARRRQVYVRAFRKAGGRAEALEEAKALSPAEVLAGRLKPAWAAGDGVPLVEAWPPGCVLHAAIPNLAVPAALEALEMLRRGAAPADLKPLYVRGADVREPTAVFDGGGIRR